MKCLEKDQWQLGVSKVFLRDGQYHILEQHRNKQITGSAIIIQKWWRMVLVRRYFLNLRRKAIKIQATYRMHRLRKKFLLKRQATIAIQAMYRMYRLRKKYKPIFKQRIIEAKKKAEEEKKRQAEQRRIIDEERKKAEANAKKEKTVAPASSGSEDDLLVMMGGSGHDTGGLEEKEVLVKARKIEVKTPPPRTGSITMPTGVVPDLDKMGYDPTKDLTAGVMTLRRKQLKFITVIPEPPPIISDSDINKYKFSDFAQKNFQRHTEKGLFKKGRVLTPEEEISFQKKKI